MKKVVFVLSMLSFVFCDTFIIVHSYTAGLHGGMYRLIGYNFKDSRDVREFSLSGDNYTLAVAGLNSCEELEVIQGKFGDKYIWRVAR